MNKPKWIFRNNHGGTGDGPSHDSSDHFKKNRLSSFVREIVQNSMDAHDNSKNPVQVIFEINKLNKKKFSGFEEIFPIIEACMNEHQKENKWYKIYNEILKNKSLANVLIFTVYDGNTTGLTGPINSETMEGSFYGLIKGKGLSNKGEISGGSYGHGASSSFIYSKTRTVFYYSKVNEEYSERFQGKASLQSHKCPVNSFRTVGTGYFGYDEDNLPPIVNEKIPKWAKEFRNNNNLNFGTSVYIPYTDFKEADFPETIISVIANFYLAIKEGKLEVKVGDTKLSKTTIDHLCDTYRKKFETKEEIEGIDENYIGECFKSIDTIRFAEESGSQEIQNFGIIHWYLRLNNEKNDNLKWKRVGVARSIGMLITRRPLDLISFNSFKFFDMFVHVEGKQGNITLKAMENPRHDSFEKERLDELDPKTAKIYKNSYNNFTKKIKYILDLHAKSNSEEKITIEVPEIFGQLSDSKQDNLNIERGSKIIISDGPMGSFKTSRLDVGIKKGTSLRQKKRNSVINPNPVDVIPNSTPNEDKSNKSSKQILQNLRISNLSSNGKKLKLFFDSPASGTFSLEVAKKGNYLSEKINFEGNESMIIKLEKNQRHSINLNFDTNVYDFVLEACIYEIN